MGLTPEGEFIAVNGQIADAGSFRTTPGGLVAPVVFDGMRIYQAADGTLVGFRMDDHWRRLVDSAKLVRFAPPDLHDASEQVGALLEANRVETEVQVLAVLTAEDSSNAYPTTPTNLVMMITAGGRVTESPGWHLRVSSWRKSSDLAIPARTKFSAGYFSSRMADLDAWEDGYDGAIFLTERGTVAEGSGYNIFVLRGGKLLTPPVTDQILEGITRDTLLEIVPKQLGINTEVRSIDRSELYLADEIFVCGTSLEVTPVLSVDRRPVGDGALGPVTTAIRDLYFATVRGELDEYRWWITPFEPTR